MQKIKFLVICFYLLFPVYLFSYINYEKLYIYSLYNRDGYNSVITPTVLPDYESFNVMGGVESHLFNLSPKIYNGNTDDLYSIFGNFILPFDNNFLSLFILNFNSYLFSERMIKISYATKIENFSFGISFKHLHSSLKANEYTEVNSYFDDKSLEKNNIGLDISALYVYRNVRANITLYNLNQPDMGFVEKDILRAGVNFIFSSNLKYLIITMALYQNLYEKFQSSNLNFFVERAFFNEQLSVSLGGNSSEVGLKTEVYIKKINKVKFSLTYQFWFPFLISNHYGNNLISVRITL